MVNSDSCDTCYKSTCQVDRATSMLEIPDGVTATSPQMFSAGQKANRTNMLKKSQEVRKIYVKIYIICTLH